MLDAINWHSFLFLLFGGMSCFFALGVLLSSNVVRMAFYLIVSLTATAGLFFLAGAKFVGAMQIMIYVGGTLVLLIFGVMLTAQAAFVSMKTKSSDWVLASIVGASLFALLFVAAVSVEDWRVPREDQSALTVAEGESATLLGWSLIGIRVDKEEQPDPQLQSGMSGYLLPFEIISIHLLVVLIGAAFLARTKTIVSHGSAPARGFSMSYSDIYFSWNGRAPREIFWLHGVIVLKAIYIFAAAIDWFLIPNDFPLLTAENGANGLGWLTVIVALLLIYPAIVIRIKRWHDRDKRGLWVLLPVIPVIGVIWEIVELGFLRGTVGTNRFGEDPLQ